MRVGRRGARHVRLLRTAELTVHKHAVLRNPVASVRRPCRAPSRRAGSIIGRHMASAAPAPLTAVDAHAAGGVVRLVTGGVPVPRGRTMAAKAQGLIRRHADLCAALTLEPRGHDGVVLAILCEPVTSGADAGVIFLHGGGPLALCGHGLIGAATIAIERRLIVPREPGRLHLDTGAGMTALSFDAIDGEGGPRVRGARYVGPPSFVFAGSVALTLRSRTVRVDVACGGAECLVIADSESAGVPLARTHIADLRRTAAAILQAAGTSVPMVHPASPSMSGLGGVVFTGPPEGSGAQLRCQTIYVDGTVDRSPSGSAVAAILAVLDCMGLAGTDVVVFESLAGTTMRARIVERLEIGTTPAVRVEVEASAWIVADHLFHLDADDPLVRGVSW
jgi:4-hydroxyproline epimerase